MTPVIVDPLDKVRLTAEVRRAEPEVIIHQLSALSGAGNFRKLDQEFALTNRFRTEVTATLLVAARTIGTRRFIAQSYCGWPYARKGGPVKTEEDPLDPHPPESFTKSLAALRDLEDTVPSTTFLRRSPCATAGSTGRAPRSAREAWSSEWSSGGRCPSSAAAAESGLSFIFSTPRARPSRRSRAARRASTTSGRRRARQGRDVATGACQGRRGETTL